MKDQPDRFLSASWKCSDLCCGQDLLKKIIPLPNVEAGKVPPPDGLISRLADVLNYDRDELSLLAGRIPETLMKEVYKNTKTIVLNFPCESDYPLQRGSTPHIMPVELCL